MKKVVGSLLLVLFLSVSAFAIDLVSVKAKLGSQVRQYLAENFDVAGNFKDRVEIFIHNNAELQQLKDAGLNVEVLARNLPNLAGTRMVKGYHTYEEIVEGLKQLAAAHPDITRLEVIGKSWEGRDIVAIKIAKDPDNDNGRLKVLAMGLHHAREWIAAEVPYQIARYLVNNYDKDPKIRELLSKRIVWVVPVVNPDGYKYSMEKYTYWRKNRRKLPGGAYGVDLNRNYGFHWGESGVSSWPSSDTYPGEKAFSEKESTAIDKFGKREKFAASVSYHSYGELNLFPYGYAYKAYAPDHNLLFKLAKGMAKLNGHTAEKSSDLYPAAGDSEDWLYSQYHTFTFTIELGRSFIPAQDQIKNIVDKNIKAFLYLVDEIGNVYPKRADGTKPLTSAPSNPKKEKKLPSYAD